MRLAAALLVASFAVLAVPSVRADPGPVPDCSTATVGVGAIVVATVSHGTQCGVAVQPYTCDVEWFGGRGLLGGFVFTCEPGVSPPCVFPVCRP